MSTLSATFITTSPAEAAATAPTLPAATPAIPVATDAADARDYAAGSQTPTLAVIDAAILLAAAAGDSERRDALMALRAAVALAEILGTLPGAPTDSGDPATRDDNA